MKILRAKGGLGNQIFQLIYLLTHSDPKETLLVDLSFFSMKFEKDYAGAVFYADQVLSKSSNQRIIYLKTPQLFSRLFWKLSNKLGIGKNSLIDNYCTNVSFYPWAVDYKKFFDLKLDSPEYGIDENSILIHVRKGDYTNTINSKIYFNCDVDYFKRATDAIKGKVKNPKFYIMSNDNDWVRNNFTFLEKFQILEIDDPVVSFKVMSKFSNFIISNSTFSWWPAMMSKSENVIAPVKWYLDEKMNKDIYPLHWILV